MRTYSKQTYYQPTRPSLQRSPQPPHRPRWRSLAYIIAGLSIIALIAGITWGIPAAVEAEKRAHQIKLEKALSDQLTQAIAPILNKDPAIHIGIGITDAQTGTTRTYGQKTAFPAASTSKIITALAYYHAVEQGTADLSRRLGAYPANFQIQQMIQQSNNTSWHLLVEDLGKSRLQRYAQDIGSDYHTGDNILSADSLSRTLIKLKTGQLLNQAHTTQLLSYMQHTNDETLIPAAISKDITAYHKYGQLGDILHDASILTKGGENYSLVIFTQTPDDTSGKARAPIIHELVRTVVPILFSERQ